MMFVTNGTQSAETTRNSGEWYVYLKNEFAANPFFWGIKTIITIHNLKFQGIWDREWVQGCLLYTSYTR